ncbi:MAG TPA: GNAT family N-acetyltransferase [Propionibacteriaceae bacterium]|jgi:L-amino acid N-acyltransferase YncA
MSRQWCIRDGNARDGEACAALYAPYVENTAVTFEVVPPTPSQMSRRIEAAVRTHAWLVLEDQGVVLGYAYGGPHKERAGYRWACESSVYLELGRRRTGAGRALYTELLERLARRGFRTVLAGMTVPNDASEGLHMTLGFEPVGTYRRIGWKLGRWHDTVWMQRPLDGGADPPATPH